MQNDLLEVCRGLQSRGVRYILVGGHAVRLNGILRATEDVDILVPFDRDNGIRLIEGLAFLVATREIDPAWFTREANEPDIENIRIADAYRYRHPICSEWRILRDAATPYPRG